MTDDFGAIAELGGAAAIEMVASALVDHGAHAAKCANCSGPVVGPFCAVCGQSRNTHRRSVRILLSDFMREIVSFDSRILRTARALMAQPGELSVAFREGRTQRYVPPVRLYLFVTLIFFLTLSIAGIAILQLQLVSVSTVYVTDKAHNVYVIKNGVRELMDGFTADNNGNVYLSDKDVPHTPVPRMKADGSTNLTVTTQPHFFARFGSVKPGHAPAKILADMDAELRKADARKRSLGAWISEHVARMFKVLATDPAAINGPLTEWIPRVLLVLLPLFALLLAGFYWRQRKEFFFVDHLVFSLNVHTFGFALLLISAAVAQIIPAGVVATVAALWFGAYLYLAMKHFYRQGWLWTGAKFASVGFIYAFCILPSAFGTIIIYSLLNL
ncbi:MAG: DUF3667 domain-containing protein [Rhizomicrobium sp.]|jgi:hypothetical protein